MTVGIEILSVPEGNLINNSIIRRAKIEIFKLYSLNSA